jgi:hypothetical protein
MSNMTKKAKAGRLFPEVLVVLILLAVTTVNALTPLVHPDGSPVSLGDIIVADFNAHAVFRQSPSVGVAPTAIFSGTPYAAPFAVAIDASGNIIVTDIGVPAVFRQSPSGGPPTTIFSGPPYVTPVGVAIDASGNIIVADQGADAVFRQSPSGGVAPTTIFSGTPYVWPVGVAIYEYAPAVTPGGGTGWGAGMLIVLIMLIVILSGVGAAAAVSRRLSVGAQRPIRL